jgi:hypothetical protein
MKRISRQPFSARLALLLSILIFGRALTTSAQTAAAEGGRNLSAAEWREDLHYLDSQMRLKHKSLFHSVSEAEFASAVSKLDADIPSLNSDQIYVRMQQLMVMVQDGHSGMDTRPIPASEAKDRIPVRFDRYPDGIYVRAAAPEYAEIVGGKVVSVGGFLWDEALRRVDSFESHDFENPGEQLAWSTKMDLNCPRILHGLGLSESRDKAEFVIEKDGQKKKIALKASVSMGNWYLNSLPQGWIDARAGSVSVPLSRRHEKTSIGLNICRKVTRSIFNSTLY